LRRIFLNILNSYDIFMDIVVIPVFNRPEFLKICLECIERADNYKNYLYIFQLDWGYDKRNIDVIKEFLGEKVISRIDFVRYKLGKQSYNVLYGLMLAARYTDDLVFLIEDDVFVGKDFFTFNEDIHKIEKNIFCSISSKNHNSERYKVIDDKDAYYISYDDSYQSIGVCFKRDVIKEYIFPHFREEYFKDISAYCDRHFGRIDWGTEQDGLIRRILKDSKLPVAFPHVPRCYHAGWYSYHRMNRMHMPYDISERVNIIRDIAFDKHKMYEINKYNKQYVRDSEPCDLNISHEKLKNITIKY